MEEKKVLNMPNNKPNEKKSGFNGIVVDDGSVKEVIRNKFGDQIGVFYFRPTDIGIIDRYDEMADKFSEIVEPLENINIGSEGGTDTDDLPGYEALKTAEKRLFDVVDYVFGGNLSEAFFGKMRPFSIVNGRFYCEIALNAVGDYISNAFDRSTRKLSGNYNGNNNQFRHGYRTGKHKGGKR